MLKNYNYMLTIILYPFMMLLSYLKLTNVIKGNFYIYLIGFMIVIFIPSFIMSLYGIVEDILKGKNKWHIILLILLSIIYLPIYYTRHIIKEEKFLGYFLTFLSILLSILTINSLNKKLSLYFTNIYSNYYAISNHFVYYSTDGLFEIDVDKSFRCTRDDVGDYVVYCDRLYDDSFIGIYSYDISYDTDEEIKEKLDFHVNQTTDYIKEKGSVYEISNYDNITLIDYDDNVILITQKNYSIDDKKYSLIIMKEVPREYINYEEYQEMINSIRILNKSITQ